jgi:hypothetical protein
MFTTALKALASAVALHASFGMSSPINAIQQRAGSYENSVYFVNW